MVVIFFKWLLLAMFSGAPLHPYYVSVTEIEHNADAHTLEISCKIFTDDLEETLKMHFSGKVDVLSPLFKKQTAAQIQQYIPKKLKVKVDGMPVDLTFLGFEEDGEGIISYFEGKVKEVPQKLEVMNKILYEYKPEQMGIMHITVKGKRQSTKLVNPDSVAVFRF